MPSSIHPCAKSDREFLRGFLKESEYRWNHRNKKDMYKRLLKEFRKRPL